MRMPVVPWLWAQLLSSANFGTSGGGGDAHGGEVGRCRLTVSKPVLKAPTVLALETTI